MKKTGTCPKCRSKNLVNPSKRKIQKKVSMYTFDVVFLICTDCGYFEEYIENLDQLRKWTS